MNGTGTGGPATLRSPPGRHSLHFRTTPAREACPFGGRGLLHLTATFTYSFQIYAYDQFDCGVNP